MNLAYKIENIFGLMLAVGVLLLVVGRLWDMWRKVDEYYRYYLVHKYLLFWRKCPECNHPNWWHIWADKTYCQNRQGGHCSCGYHIDR